jgi:RNA polymerase-binding transcription factor
MEKQKLDYFRNLLLEERHQALNDFRDDRAAAVQDVDGVIDSVEVSQQELTKSTALDLAGRESDLVKEIDAALQRIEDSTYGQCARCGKPIDEKRLKAMPTALYDTQCQAAIEAAEGIETPTL